LELTLPNWYWDKIKTSEVLKTIPKNDVSEDHMCGTIDVILARIPPEEFEVHQAVQIGYTSDANEASSSDQKTSPCSFWMER